MKIFGMGSTNGMGFNGGSGWEVIMGEQQV